MTIGRVAKLQALVPVVFCPSGRPRSTIEFVVDTGFTEFLTLPQEVVSSMVLERVDSIEAELADGRTVLLPVHAATVFWCGAEVVLPVLATGHRPLLGTGLLKDLGLQVEFWEGGTVSVQPRARTP